MAAVVAVALGTAPGAPALGTAPSVPAPGVDAVAAADTRTLSLAAGDISKYWSAGWLKPGTTYANGAGCTLYKPPNSDPDSTDNTGIHLGADATSLLNASTIRIVGIDANRTGIAASTLSRYGMTGYGSKATNGPSKIDYLFVKGSVQPSSIDHTVSGTKSNHLALYGFIGY